MTNGLSELSPPRLHSSSSTRSLKKFASCHLPIGASDLLVRDTIFCDDPAVIWPRSSLLRRNVCHALVARYFKQLRYGCNNPQCITPTCFSCHKRVSRGPARPLSALSARTLAFFLASQDDPERDLCPHPLSCDGVNLNPPSFSLASNEPSSSATEVSETFDPGYQTIRDRKVPGKERGNHTLNIQARVFRPVIPKLDVQATDVRQDQPGLSGEGTCSTSITLDEFDSVGDVNPKQARRDSKSITQSLFHASYTRFLQIKKIPQWILQRESWFGPPSHALSEVDSQSTEERLVNHATKSLPRVNKAEGQRKPKSFLSNGHSPPYRENYQHEKDGISNGIAMADATPNTSDVHPNLEGREQTIFPSHAIQLQQSKNSDESDLGASNQNGDAEEPQDIVSTLTTQPLRPQTLSHFSPENIGDLRDMVQACNRLNHMDQRFSEFMGRTVTPIPIYAYTRLNGLESQMSMAFATQSIAYVLSNTPGLLRSFRSPNGTTLDLPVIAESFRDLRSLDYEPQKIIPCLTMTTGALYPDAVLKSRSPVLKARRSAKGAEINRLSRHGTGSPCVLPGDDLGNDETTHIIKIAFAALVAALPLLKPTLWDAVRLLRASGFVAPDWYIYGRVLNVTVLCEVMDALEDENSIALMTKLVKVIAARNCADKMSTSSCQSRTDTEQSPSRFSNIIRSVYMEVVSLLVSYRVNIDAETTEEDTKMEKSAISVTSAIVEWLRTVILKHWDGKPKVSRWGPVGGAIEQMSFLYEKCTEWGWPTEIFQTPFLVGRLDTVDMPAEWVSEWPNKNMIHLLSHAFLFPPSALIKYFRATNYAAMAKAFEAGAMTERTRVRLQIFAGPVTGRGRFLRRRLDTALKQYLVLDIRRGNILDDALNQLWRREKRELLKPIKVRLGQREGEEGVDQGGVQQEFFRMAIAEALKPEYGLFTTDPRTLMSWFQPCSLEPLYRFELLGLLASLAVYNGLTLPVTFPLALYRKLLDLEVCSLGDIEDGWPDLAKGFTELLTWSDGDVEDVFVRSYVFSTEAPAKTIFVDMQKIGRDDEWPPTKGKQKAGSPTTSEAAGTQASPIARFAMSSSSQPSNDGSDGWIAIEQRDAEQHGTHVEQTPHSTAVQFVEEPIRSSLSLGLFIDLMEGQHDLARQTMRSQRQLLNDTRASQRPQIDPSLSESNNSKPSSPNFPKTRSLSFRQRTNSVTSNANMVTNANRQDYVSDYIFWLTHKSIAPQYNAFARGFYTLISQKALTLFTPSLLRSVVEGLPSIDLHALQQITHYEGGYTSSSPTIIAFWEILNGWEEERVRKMLEFVTSSDRVPAQGYESLTFVVQRNGWAEEERLPTSMTCFGRLLLPEYKNRDVLEEKLGRAVEENRGFGVA